MKIVYITPSLYLAGGVERVLTTKMNYLAECGGHDITIVLTDGEDKQPHFPLSPRVKVVNLNIGFERMWNQPLWRKVWIYLLGQWSYRRKLRSALMEIGADITVSTLRREINFLCDIPDGSRKVGELHVTRHHYRHFEPSESNPFKRLIASYWSRQLINQLKRLDRMVVLTPEEASRWPEVARMEVIPNPLPFDMISLPQLDQKLFTEQHRVITVARYSTEKGIDLLMEAWSKVSSVHPDWTLDIYGSGDAAPYEALAQSNGLRNIRFQGPSSDIRSRYLEHDFCILPSRFEGFGMTIIEAAACGLPTVAFACDGPRSLIVEEQTGLLVPLEDTTALTQAIGRLMEQPDQRNRMAHQAWEASKAYSLESVMQRWLRLFDSLMPQS